MENNKKEDLVLVSFDRILASLKKFWWIPIILLALMLFYGAGTYYNTLDKSELTEYDKMPVVIPEKEEDRVYLSKALYEFKVDMNQYIKELGLVMSESEKNQEFYDVVSANYVSYINALLHSNDLYDKMDAAFVSNGYVNLAPAPRYTYDDGYDMISASLGEGGTYYVTYSGTGGRVRNELGMSIVVEYLNENFDKCDFGTSKVVSTPSVYFRYNAFGQYIETDPSEDSVRALIDQWAEHNAIANGTANEFSFTVGALFKVPTIIKGIVGFVVGLIIIFVLSVFDKKIRNKEELSRFFDSDDFYLGGIDTKADTSLEITSVTVAENCRKNEISDVAIATIGSKGYKSQSENAAKFAAALKTLGINTSLYEGIEKDANTIKALSSSKAVIIYLSNGLDDVNTMDDAMIRLGIVGANVVGCVLSK